MVQDARAVRLQNPVKTRNVCFALLCFDSSISCNVVYLSAYLLKKILGFHFVMTRDMNISAEWPCAIYILCSHKNLASFFLIPDNYLTSIQSEGDTSTQAVQQNKRRKSTHPYGDATSKPSEENQW